MFVNTSMTGVGVLVYIIALFLRWLGVDGIENEQIVEFIINLSGIIGFVLMIWGQIRRKDISWMMFRKK